MENYIDLINAYLTQTLSKAEILAFENRLKTDVEFNSIYNEHLIILGGIERVALKQNINNARQSYIRTKWLKYFGISIGIILLSILAYSLITKSQSAENSNATENTAVEFVVDSIEIEDKAVSKTIIDTITTKKSASGTKVVTTSKKVDETVIDEKQIVNRKTSSLKDIITFSFKEPLVIKVNTEEDFKITLREGTKISIPKNAFVNEKTGQPVSGTIDLQVSEFYKLYDMLLADLSTKSNDKILETGGMLFVAARKNGTKLKLGPEKKMKIVFNNSGKPNMQLFEGERSANRINWKLGEQIETNVIDELTGQIVTEEFYKDAVIPFQSVEEVPIYPGCENENDRRKCMSDAIDKLISRKFNTSIAEDLNITGKQRIMTSFEIDTEGNIGKIEVRASHKSLAEEAIRVMELLPKVIPGKQKEKAIRVKYAFPMMYTVRGNNNKRRVNQEKDSTMFIMKSDKGFIKKIEEKPTALINNSDIERYTFATTNLGWINCDRFVNSKKRKIKYKLKIKDAEGANVKMIFKSISSVLPSYKNNNQYNFGDVPVNEDVILLAIKKKNDKLFLGIKHVKTEAVSELDLEFREVTIAELKTELYKLNNEF